MLSFHPHVACSHTVFLSSVLLMGFVSILIMASFRLPVVIVIVSILVAVIPVVFVTMVVVVVVCTAHCCNGNGERFHVLCLKFEHVFARFEFVNRDCCVCWAIA